MNGTDRAGGSQFNAPCMRDEESDAEKHRYFR
jgi:hypothetical protein